MEKPSKKVGAHTVRCIENVWIPMKDGVRLAARVLLPDDAETHPVPALLEYIPYRKRDHTRLPDEATHPYLASHGYACVRVDIRGAGDSEGLPQDEYVVQEQDDGMEIIAWLATQPWCTGKVGMFGFSWGGFSALQVAARRPPALKAIITHCSTDDRYRDGDHWMGGCIEETFFTWGAYATLIGARAPDPAIVGPCWREMWMARLESLEFYVGNWLAHPHCDDYWKHASIAEDYSQITCAVYAVGGWADHFNSTVAKMLAGLQCPRKGLIGPWNHAYPHVPALGPSIDWLSEALRWWDYWLKDSDTGIMAEPMYRVWMQERPAMRGTREVPGRWVAEEQWPSARINPLRLYLTEDGLSAEDGPETARSLAPLQTVGITSPARYYRDAGLDIGLPTDQRIDDARSLTFDSASLTDDLEILGAPVVSIDLAVDTPVAFLAVRLTEVEPTGESRRVSFAVLNLTHRNGDENPLAMECGKRTRVNVKLHDCAHRFHRGNRIRVAISTSYWPAFWPSPAPTTLTVIAGQSELELPRRAPRAGDEELRDFGPAFVPENSGKTVLTDAEPETKIYEWDVARETLTIRSAGNSGRWRLNATGTEMAAAWREVSTISDHDPTRAQLNIWMTESYSRDEWNFRVEASLGLRLDAGRFFVSGEIQAFERDQKVFVRTWDKSIPRRLL